MDGINDSGQVAGAGNNGTTFQAFISTASGTTPIPVPNGWSNMGAVGINNYGQVAGTGSTGTSIQGFIGTASGVDPIATISGLGSMLVYGLNDLGQVAGYASLGGLYVTFIGTASESIPFALGTTGYLDVLGINDSGEVAATFIGSPSVQAYIITASGSTPISPLNGWSGISALAINDSGLVTGNGYTFVPGGLFGQTLTATQAFIGTASGVTAIPLPPGTTIATVAGNSLNGSGVVVGGSDAGGWIWTASNGTQLLNTFVPSGWTISDAISISNSGLILAQGSFDGGATEYVELSSAASSPEPAAGLFMASGLMLLICARRRAKFSVL